MLSSGRFQHKEAILGVNRDEGTFWILFALPGFSKDTASHQNRTMYLDGVDQIAWDLNLEQVVSFVYLPHWQPEIAVLDFNAYHLPTACKFVFTSLNVSGRTYMNIADRNLVAICRFLDIK